MASTSEVGHAKNVANLTALIHLLQEMGPMYNPANPQIQIINLIGLRDGLNNSLQNLNDKIAPFKTAVVSRETAFKELLTLSTRVKNSFNAFGFPEHEKDNVLTIVKKIRGEKPVRTAVGLENQETQTISNAQLSYTNKVNHLQVLISLLNNQPAYQPNESDLSINALNSFFSQLEALNNDASQKAYALVTARKNRNDLLYNINDNLLSLINPIKEYIKSVEGAHTYYKAAVRLKFSNNPNS